MPCDACCWAPVWQWAWFWLGHGSTHVLGKICPVVWWRSRGVHCLVATCTFFLLIVCLKILINEISVYFSVKHSKCIRLYHDTKISLLFSFIKIGPHNQHLFSVFGVWFSVFYQRMYDCLNGSSVLKVETFLNVYARVLLRVCATCVKCYRGELLSNKTTCIVKPDINTKMVRVPGQMNFFHFKKYLKND